jgi:hypothetical protein
MLQKIGEFLLEQSFKIMISGFVITSIGIFFFIKMQNTPQERAGFTVTACGLCVWLIGRVGIIIERRRARKRREAGAGEQSRSET